MSEDKTYVKRSHRIIFFFIRLLSFVYTRLFLNYRCRDKYRMKDGESVLVVSNHQTDADPFCIIPSFSKPIYPVATDTIFSGKFRAKLFTYLGVIPKKKSVMDARSVIKMNRLLQHGGSVLLFPEGNRYYAEFQYYIAPAFGKFIKNTGATVVVFNLHGGSGVSPRFKNKNRRGRFFGQISRIITKEEYAEMSDAELESAIRDGIRVYDSDYPYLYKSRKRAEYLERMLFACPVCGRFETIYSRGRYVSCTVCGMKAEYGEDLHLHGVTPGFTMNRLCEWWEYEKNAVKNMEIQPGKIIFHDDDAKLFSSTPFTARELLCRGAVSISDSVLSCGDRSFDVSGIESASVVSGRNLTFVYDKKDYTIRGGKRFDPLKYIFLFNRLDTAMHRNSSDKYFNLEV